tara:strand:+ start:1579 stop:3441 length:1863 start_codon:yes stop_codon:yes gene_type:complete
MCGIAGFFGSNYLKPSSSQIKKTLKIMQNRGKDGEGFITLNVNKDKKLNFLHTRLAIIDPSKNSNQPFEDEEGAIIFNGMIYNYSEIKKKLIKQNIKFRSKSDTEVLLKYLNYKGIENLDDLDGMWSFAYYSKIKKKLYLSRDRFGEKPLYFYIDNSNLFFGSYYDYIINLYKNKKFKINFDRIENFIKYNWKSFGDNLNYESIFENIYSVKPGSYLEINEKSKLSEKFYWDPISIKINNKLKYHNEKKVLRNKFKNIMNLRLKADYPVACLLSGGIDSSSLVSTAYSKLKKKLTCFSIDPQDKDYNEKNLINKTIKKYNLKHYYVTPKKNNKYNLKIVKNLIETTGNIIPTTTWLIFFYINKLIKQKKFKVILSGTGGDEFFSGYYIHHLHYLKSIMKNKKNFNKKYNEWKNYVRPFIRSKVLSDYNLYNKNISKIDPSFFDYLSISKYFKKFKKKKKIKNVYYNNFHKNELFKDISHFSLPGQLPFLDIVSMTNGLECRSPILSKDLFYSAFNYPGNFLVRNGYGKAIFRDAMKGIVDNEILNSREKVGFFLRLEHLFDLNDKNIHKLIFKNKKINNLLNIKEIKKLMIKKNKSNQECHLIFGLMNVTFLLNKYKKYL